VTTTVLAMERASPESVRVTPDTPSRTVLSEHAPLTARVMVCASMELVGA
jgi:hypothetical protein